MRHLIIKNINRLERLFILMALIIAGLIVSTITSVVVTLAGSGLTELSILRISQISSQILTFILPPIAYAFLTKENPVVALGFNRLKIHWLLLGLCMIYAIMPLNSVFAEWNANIKLPESMSTLEEIMKNLQEKATEIMEKMVNVDNIGGLIINLIMIAGLAAFGEELLFRSIIQTSLIKICRNTHIGIILASIIFSFIHFEFYGFLPRLVLGLLLGYMFYYSKNIWIPMAMHFANNGTIVFLYYLNNKGVTNINIDTFGQTNTPILIASIIMMAALFYASIKISNKENKETII